MRILITGKGGTGKTSLSAALSLLLSEIGFKVLALDTDSTPNLAQSLGIDPSIADEITPLAMNDELIRERTGVLPGSGWGAIFKLNPKVDDIIEKFGVKINDNLSLVVVGSIDASKQGCLCPAIALAKRFIRYSLRRFDGFVIVDSEAGAEVFGRGLAENFDMMFTICEPTVKSIKISRNMIRLAKQLDIKRSIVVVNKVIDNELAMKLAENIISGAPIHIIHYDDNLPAIEYNGYGINKLPKESRFMIDTKQLIDKYILIES